MTTFTRLFNLATMVCMAGWVVLFAFPLWPQTGATLVFSLSILLLCGLYGYLLLLGKRHDDSGHPVRGHFFSLKGVIQLFRSPQVVLAGWVHYLAFDLMVGLYVVHDAARHGIAHLWLLPVLFLTLMFGPLGLLVYLGLRAAVGSGVWLIPSF